MLVKNLATCQRFFKCQRYEWSFIWINCLIVNWPFHLRNAIKSHWNRFSLTTEVPCKLFLSLNDIEKHWFIDWFTFDHKGNHVWTNVFKFRVNCYYTTIVVLNISFTRKEAWIVCRFSATMNTKLACNTVCWPEVRTVCIIQFNLNNTLVFWLRHIRFFIKFSLSAC